MAHKIIDRCKETTSTTGTGTLTLTGAVSGFVAMADATIGLTTNGDTSWFCAENGSEWEVFLGTRSDATHLARTTVLASSNSGSAVSFTAAPTVFSTVPGSKMSPLSGPAFRAYLGSNQTGLANATYVALVGATEDFDTNACYDTSNGRFTPNVPGYYHFDYGIMLVGVGLTEGVSALYKNDTIFAGCTYHGSVGNFRGTVGSCLVYLNGTTDYVDVRGNITATSGRYFYAGTDASYFSGYLARPA